MRFEKYILQIYEKIYYKQKVKVSSQIYEKMDKENIIFTIAFNNYEVIEEQIKGLETHCREEYSYWVADNSTNLSISRKIEELCRNHSKVIYYKLPKWKYKKLNPSNSHGVALNYVFKGMFKLCRNPKNVLILDHDIFPMKDFSMEDIAHGQDIYGLKMQNEKIWYIWPGFMYINLEKIDLKKLNFKPGYGGDTGSLNWQEIFSSIPENTLKFAVLRKQWINDEHDATFFRQSSEVDILDESWLHMVNASDWAGIGKMDLKLQTIKKLME